MHLMEWIGDNVPANIGKISKDKIQLIVGESSDFPCALHIASAAEFRKETCLSISLERCYYPAIDDLIDKFRSFYS